MTNENENENVQANNQQSPLLSALQMLGMDLEDVSELIHQNIEEESLEEREERILEQDALDAAQADTIDAVTQLVVSEVVDGKVNEVYDDIEAGRELEPYEAILYDCIQDPAVPGKVSALAVSEPEEFAGAVARLHAVMEDSGVYEDLDVEQDPEVSEIYDSARDRLLEQEDD